MSKPLVALLSVLAIVLVFALWRTTSETVTPAYINLFNECESSPDYGTLISDTALTFREAAMTNPTTRRLSHGERVELLSVTGDVAQVRSGTGIFFIAPSLLSDYDPASGVQPDPTSCVS